MKFALIVCTYNRQKSIARLMVSIESQNLLPDEIIVVDGSHKKDETLANIDFKMPLTYYHVSESDRGLTKQRNFGLSKVSPEADVVCFLDDDVVLKPDYFKQIINTFNSDNRCVGVGGYAINEVQWNLCQKQSKVQRSEFYCDGYFRDEPLRDRLRNLFGLSSNLSPGKMPSFGHGRSSLPPSGQTYEVDLLIGMAMSFKRSLFEKIQFSEFFQGYGLYEDADFSLRAAQLGKLYINTNAQLEHHHEPAGRPNMFKYGRMVVRNGYYVWRIKNPRPSLKDRFKWHAITLLLLSVRATNVITGPKHSQSLMETIGRKIGYIELWIRPKKPKKTKLVKDH
jgi:glycosyltransferase involved in cell wall biosynthesis